MVCFDRWLLNSHTIHKQTRMMIGFLLIAITVAAMEDRTLRLSQRRLESLETTYALNQAVQDWETYGRDAVSDHNNYGPIEDWDVSLITSMDETFKDSTLNETLVHGTSQA